jgi:hypothetical protein
MSVTATATPVRGVAHIAVRVVGLPAGKTGTLTVTADGPSVTLHLGPRCGLVGLRSSSCAVRTTPASFDFLAVVLRHTATTVTFTVQPDAGVDSDPSDNTTRVLLTP